MLARNHRHWHGVVFICLLLAAAAGPAAAQVPTEPPVEPPVDQVEESSGPPPCGNGYTYTMCAVENEKFVRNFDVAAGLILPLSCALILPLLFGFIRTSGMGWWRASPLSRWWRFIAAGAAAALLFLWLLPMLGQRGVLPPSVAFFAYQGMKSDFVESCSTCSSQVSNYRPLFGFFGSLGMPEMGLAVEHPFQLLGAIVIAFIIASGLFFVVHLGWRKRSGFSARCLK